MKICTECKIEKDFSEFAKRSDRNGKLHSSCKECKRKRDREAYKTESRKISIRKGLLRSQERLRNYIIEYKKERCCVKCGDKRYYVLDFHHEGDKEYNISDGITRGISTKTLQKEIDKCILVCANCHRELHYLEKIGI